MIKASVILATIALAALSQAAHAAPARKIRGVSMEGSRGYLATGENRAELVIVDLVTGATLGAFNAPGKADALSVKLVRPGIVKLGRRRSRRPELYRLDVSDPTNIIVLSAAERMENVRWRPDRLPPVMFPDVNGDGIYRLGCVGDSNTSPVTGATKWCELLRDTIDDRTFDVVNVAVPGATACENRRSGSDARMQMADALALEVDAVVLAFGTNDRLQGRQPAEIAEAYVAQAEAAALAGVAFYAATTPPMGGCQGAACTKIAALNTLLHAAFGDHVVDFFEGFSPQYFGDSLHLNDLGHAMRAERALGVLGNPLMHDLR